MRKQKRKRKTASRGPNRFKKSEATRLVKATLAAGLNVTRIEADPLTGKIAVFSDRADASKESDLAACQLGSVGK